MDFKDYYKTLSVEPDADSKTIKTAYRKLARKYHPDVSQDHQAEDKFKEVSEAYEVLKDPQKRAEYDEIRRYGGQQSAPGWRQREGFSEGQTGQPFEGDFSDFFNTMFGAHNHAGRGSSGHGGFQSRTDFSQRGADIETELPIFLEDTLAESGQKISYSLPYRDDQGRVNSKKKTLNVKIPAGVSDGERIRLKGQGGQGFGGAPSGDLYLHIRIVPHPLFDVEAHNLIITVPLAPWEAALGACLEVPTLTGKIKLTIPSNSQTGQRLRIRGKGLPHKQGQGDLYAVLKVVMPTTTSKESEQHWQALASAAAFEPRKEWRK